MPLPSEERLASSYKLEWLRQRRKESHLARERRARARASEQLQEFAQEFEPARLELAPRWAWEHAGQAEAGQAEAGQAEAGQAEAGQAEVAQAEAGLLTQRREWEEVVCHRRQLSLDAQASERTDPERRPVVVFVGLGLVFTERRVSTK